MGDTVEVAGVLHFDVNEEEMTNRIMERGKTSGRIDDNLESLRKRFNNFKNEQMPIIDMYDKMGKTKKINGFQEIDKVFEDVQIALAEYI